MDIRNLFYSKDQLFFGDNAAHGDLSQINRCYDNHAHYEPVVCTFFLNPAHFFFKITRVQTIFLPLILPPTLSVVCVGERRWIIVCVIVVGEFVVCDIIHSQYIHIASTTSTRIEKVNKYQTYCLCGRKHRLKPTNDIGA